MTTSTDGIVRLNRRLRRGDDFWYTITIPSSEDPDDYDFLAQVRADPSETADVLATWAETRVGRLITFTLDADTTRALPDRCGSDLQVTRDGVHPRTILEHTFVVTGDYSRETGS